jgi:chaperonin cofactor prefoldin
MTLEDLDRLNKLKDSHPLKHQTKRLLLESLLVKQLNKVIEKLNNEVDMLTKQKKFLQSKLREKYEKK